MDSWEYIETHDGSHKPVWLFAPDLNPTAAPAFCGEGYYLQGHWIAAHFSRGEYHSKFVHPSMWRPLPDPPDSDEDGP